MKNEEIIIRVENEVKSRTNEKRFSHILAVARECDVLSMLFNMNEEESFSLHISALLHDITKNFTIEEQLELCKKYGIKTDAYMLKSPKVFHAITGAYLAKELFPQIVDDKIFGNITCHTTGKENMSLSEKLLYLADYIEDTRTFKDCVELREYFYTLVKSENVYTALDKTILLSFDMTIKDLMSNGSMINGNTVAARNFLLLNNVK